MRAPLAALALLLLHSSAPAADETGSFTVRLGRDTTGVETYRRGDRRLEVDQVGRTPRVLRRKYTYDLADGAITRFTMVVTPPGSSTPTQTVEATVGSDSIRVRTQNGSAPARISSVAAVPGVVVVPSSSPWAVYEAQLMKRAGSRRDSLRTPLWFVGASNVGWLSIRGLGRDSVSLSTDRGDVYHVRVNRAGLIQGVLPVSGTQKFSVDRGASADLDALAASYQAREQAGAGLGTLSPRDTVQATAGGAALWVDYGRPSKRGRVIFGEVVPYGEVWRTGANAATQFRTDHALDFGGTVVPAGFYTLWTLPGPTGWKLIVNSETGQWGTAHKPEKDLFTIDMKLGAAAEPVERFTIAIRPGERGGALVLEWDTVRAEAAFETRP